MRKSLPQSVNLLFDDATSLQAIQKRAVALSRLNRTLKALLPVNLHAHCRAANYRQHRLIIEVSSASWLVRLRYEQDKLLSALRSEVLPALSGIDWVINPALNTETYCLNSPNRPAASVNPKASRLRKRELSANSAALLEDLANGCTRRLKETLIKLAQHAKNTNNDN